VRYFVKARAYLMEDEIREGEYLEVIDGKFGDFYKVLPKEATIENLSDFTIAPGLFDTHIHGVKNHDVMDGTTEATLEISKEIVKLGVTRFLPTTLTSSSEALEKAIVSVKKAVDTGLCGAESEGIYLEGPHFTERHKGAQNPSYFRDPSYEEFNEWQKLAEGAIVKIALAPERQGAYEFIEAIRKDGVYTAIGHSDASYNCCKQATEAGASNYVHLFNGMSGMHHRNPGVVGAALTDSSVFNELICDGHHVHPDIATLAYRIKGDKIVLITDCMRAGLMPDGTYHLGEFPVVMEKGIAKTNEGSLAGSTLTLIEGIKNLYKWSSEPLYKIWHLASLSPAQSLGKQDYLGSISKGKLADYVVFDDTLSIQAVSVEGEFRYLKN